MSNNLAGLAYEFVSDSNVRPLLRIRDRSATGAFSADMSLRGLSASNTNARVLDIANNSNAVTISTASNGVPVERLRVDAAGNVGVGTTAPQSRLHVVTSNSVLVAKDGSADNIILNGATNASNQLIMGYHSTSNYAALQAVTQNLSYRPLCLNPDGGNVGVGTTNPGYALHVVNSTRGILRLEETTAGQQYNAVQMYGPCNSCEVGQRTDTGLMYFATPANSGETNAKMVITTSGNVGIGTPAPSSLLDVAGNISNRGGGSSTSGYVNMVQSGNTTNTGYLEFRNGDTTRMGYIGYGGNSALLINVEQARHLNFYTNSIERMRINSDGSMKVSGYGNNGTYYYNAYNEINEINGNTAYHGLYVVNRSTANCNGVYIVLSGASPNNTTNRFLSCDDSTGSLKAAIMTNGSYQSAVNSYGGISDIKYKTNIVDAGSQWNDLKQLRVRKFNMTGYEFPMLGLVAQEAELVSPGLVDVSEDMNQVGEKTGEVTKSIKYSVLYMKAIKALQEAMERIEHLETTIKELQTVKDFLAAKFPGEFV